MSSSDSMMAFWMREKLVTPEQMEETMRLGEFTGFESFVMLRHLVDGGMPVPQAMEAVRKQMREDGLIPLNREI